MIETAQSTDTWVPDEVFTLALEIQQIEILTFRFLEDKRNALFYF